MRKHLSFDRIDHILYLLHRPREEVQFQSPEKMVEAMETSEKKLTIHLYRTIPPRGKPRYWSEFRKWPYHQIYLALQEDKINALICDGDTSSGREHHNHCLDLLLSKETLVKEIPTTVLVMQKKELLAYYFHPTFAYVKADIGQNWDRDIAKKLEASKWPHSEYSSWEGHRVSFWKGGKETLIYTALEEDGVRRRLREKHKR